MQKKHFVKNTAGERSVNKRFICYHNYFLYLLYVIITNNHSDYITFNNQYTRSLYVIEVIFTLTKVLVLIYLTV